MDKLDIEATCDLKDLIAYNITRFVNETDFYLNYIDNAPVLIPDEFKEFDEAATTFLRNVDFNAVYDFLDKLEKNDFFNDYFNLEAFENGEFVKYFANELIKAHFEKNKNEYKFLETLDLDNLEFNF